MEQKLTILEGVATTPLNKIYHPKGNLYHALKCSEESFSGFGEAYFTTIYKDNLKGWKQHKEMVLNFVVPVGDVFFYFYSESLSKGAYVRSGSGNYVRITVQPRIWVAFRGMADGLNLILNIGSVPHNPSEVSNAELDAFPFPLDDNVEQ